MLAKRPQRKARPGRAIFVQVVNAVNRGRAPLETVVAIRDKVISAYQDIIEDAHLKDDPARYSRFCTRGDLLTVEDRLPRAKSRVSAPVIFKWASS